MKGAKLLFRCLVIIGYLVLLTINGFAQKTNIKEHFGDIDGGGGNSTTISVENGVTLFLSSSDKHAVNNVFLRLSKAEANKLISIFEKALADLAKPVQLLKNQTSEKEIGTGPNRMIIVRVIRNSSGAYLKINNYDNDVINRVPLILHMREAQKYLETLKNAVKSMK